MGSDLSEMVNILITHWELWDAYPGEQTRAAHKEEALGAVSRTLGVSSNDLLDQITLYRREGYVPAVAVPKAVEDLG